MAVDQWLSKDTYNDLFVGLAQNLWFKLALQIEVQRPKDSHAFFKTLLWIVIQSCQKMYLVFDVNVFLNLNGINCFKN